MKRSEWTEGGMGCWDETSAGVEGEYGKGMIPHPPHHGRQRLWMRRRNEGMNRRKGRWWWQWKRWIETGSRSGCV